jgi:hypothetical protein
MPPVASSNHCRCLAGSIITGAINLFVLHSGNMRTSFYAVLLAGSIILVSLITCAQLRMGAGTLIILNATKDEIVVAADSRTHIGYPPQDLDKRCKINVFGNKVIFAAGGMTESFAKVDPGTPTQSPGRYSSAFQSKVQERRCLVDSRKLGETRSARS